MTLLAILGIGLLGGVGAVLRHVLHNAGRSKTGLLAPVWRILAINVGASFVAGFAFAVLPDSWQPFVIAGFCGGLSTWSTFMTDAARAFGERRAGRAFGTLLGHLGYGLVAAFAGLLLGGLLLGA